MPTTYNTARTTGRKKHLATTGLRYVAIVRISKDRDEQSSTATQDGSIDDEVSKRGGTLVATFIEQGRSGYKEGVPRPDIDQAMHLIETGQADVLIVWKLDRLIRRTFMFVELWNRIDAAGGQFVSVTEQFDTRTTTGRTMLLMAISFAEMESDAKRDRAIPFHNHRKEKGLPPGGPRPFGYQRIDKALVIDEREAHIIQQMATDVLAGRSIASIMRDLQVTGSKGVPVTQRGITRMLTSPTIAGLRKAPDGDEGYVQGNWPAIIDRPTFDALCTLLSDPRRRTNFTDGEAKHLLSGLAKCSDCKVGMVRKNHPRGMRYLCRQCDRSIPETTADRAVEAWLLLTYDREAWQLLQSQGRAFDPSYLQRIEAERADISEMKALRLIDQEEYRKQMTALAQQLEAATTMQPLKLPDIDDLQSGWFTLTLTEKRALLTQVTSSITILPYVSQGANQYDRVHIDK